MLQREITPPTYQSKEELKMNRALKSVQTIAPSPKATINTVNSPWEGLGAKVSPKDSLDTIAKNADLNWQAKRSPVLYAVSDSIVSGTNDVIYRSDNSYQLGIVTDKYNIVQPHEVIELYRDLVSLSGWKLDVVGNLDKGRRIWALAKTDASFFAGNDTDDIVDIYLLLSTTFDGSSSTQPKFVAMRNSGLNSISLQGLGRITLHHKSVFDPKKIKEKLGVYKKIAGSFEEQVKKLVDTKITDDIAVRFLIDILENEGMELDKLSTRQTNIIAKVFESYKEASFTSSQGTAWGLLNALTYHVDYNVGRNENNRIRAAWFGLGETLKLKAIQKLLTLGGE